MSKKRQRAREAARHRQRRRKLQKEHTSNPYRWWPRGHEERELWQAWQDGRFLDHFDLLLRRLYRPIGDLLWGNSGSPMMALMKKEERNENVSKGL